MNKIYKVIWSKVKHQYVVVSELAHSNGKQSRTSRNSIRSRIAALVVCGAIAAFGVFSALPTSSAFAEVAGGEATQSQYIAIAIEGNPGEGNNDATWHKGSLFSPGHWELNDEKTYGDYTYIRQTVTVGDSQKQYWVRKGYDITAIQGERHKSINDDTDYIIDAKKNAQYDASSDQGLLQAYQTTTSVGKITTLTGVNIENLDTGVYGGASNTSGVTTPATFGYHIKVGGDGAASDGYIRVTNDPKSSNPNFSTYFSYDINLENNGSYSYENSNGEKVIVPNNKIYSIDGKLGVFTDAKGNLYTGDVYGDNNEILLSGSDGNKIYSYWGTKINDLSQTIGNMTLDAYNNDRKKLQDQAATYHGDDITNITVKKATEGNGGTLSLNRVGIYNDQTGEYTSTDPVPGTITVTSEGGTGNKDVAIKFANEDGSFTVDAGSKVIANNGAGGTDLETISVNGQTFNVIGGAISGQIDSEGNVKIQQGNKAPVTIGKVSDWNVKSGQINGSTLTLNTENAYGGATDTVTIENVASKNYVDTNIDNSKTEITTAYEKYFNDNDKYVTGGTINNEDGTINLTGTKGLTATISGLESYVKGIDNYVTEGVVSEDGKTLHLTMNNGTPVDIDLPNFTEGLSSTDYRLVPDQSGEYKVSADGKLTLKVQDMNNPGAQPEDVAISGIAQKDYVDGQFNSIDNSITNIEGDITEINTTVDTHDQKLKHIEHHDGILGIGDYTTVEGTDFYNDGSISSKVDSILNNTTNSFDFNRNGGSFTTEKESGTGMPLVGGTKTTTTDKAEFNEDGATFTNKTTTEEYHFLQPTEKTEITSSTNIKGGTITISSSARDDGKKIVIDGTVGEMSGLSNTTLDVDGFAKSNRAATEEQLQLAMSQAGENATKGDTYLHNGTEQIITDKGTVTGYKVNEDGTVTMTVANADGTKSRDSVVIGNVASKTALDAVTENVNAGWTATAGEGSIAVNPTDGTTLGFAGDENVTVTADGTNRQIKVGLNDYIQLGDNNGLIFDGDNGTISATNSITVGTGASSIYIGNGTLRGLTNIDWNPKGTYVENQAATQGQLQDMYNMTVHYEYVPGETEEENHLLVNLGGGYNQYNSSNHSGGVHLNNVAYATEADGGSAAVNVDYLNDKIDEFATTGEMTTDKHLVTNPDGGNYKVKDDNTVDLVVKDDADYSQTVTIENVAKADDVGNVNDYSSNNVVVDGENLATSVGKLDDAIGNIKDYSSNNVVVDGDDLATSVGKLDEAIGGLEGDISSIKGDSITQGEITTEGDIVLKDKDGDTQATVSGLTDAYVDDVTFKDNTLTISQTDKYGNDTYEDITVNGIASTDDISEVKTDITNIIGGTKEEITNKYEEAGIKDKDNETPGTLVDADIALNNKIQSVASTSYANDMYLNERINNVENRLGDVEERIDKVGAMAAAIANLRTMGYDPEAPTEIAVGVGQYKSETGLALGIFHYPNQDFMLSASISTSGDEVMGGIGATWKFGRKSAEERAKDEEARHLEQAEEMKKLAQQEKVKAQAQRHAKLLAERQQASQKNA